MAGGEIECDLRAPLVPKTWAGAPAARISGRVVRLPLDFKVPRRNSRNCPRIASRIIGDHLVFARQLIGEPGKYTGVLGTAGDDEQRRNLRRPADFVVDRRSRRPGASSRPVGSSVSPRLNWTVQSPTNILDRPVFLCQEGNLAGVCHVRR